MVNNLSFILLDVTKRYKTCIVIIVDRVRSKLLTSGINLMKFIAQIFKHPSLVNTEERMDMKILHTQGYLLPWKQQ